MRPFVSGTDADFEGLALLHGVDAALSQHTPMEEGVAGPIGEFDEPEPLFGVEPLNDPVDRGTGRVFERLAEPTLGSERTWLWAVGISVEVATPRMTKILISQLWFLVGSCPINRVERLAVALLQI